MPTASRIDEVLDPTINSFAESEKKTELTASISKDCSMQHSEWVTPCEVSDASDIGLGQMIKGVQPHFFTACRHWTKFYQRDWI